MTVRKPVAPLAFNCVTLMVIRAGSAIVHSEFGERPVASGDAVLLSANTPCGSTPEGSATVTTIYLETRYLIEQLYWQHAGHLQDPLEAWSFAEELFSQPTQVLRLDPTGYERIIPWLDELVSLSNAGSYVEEFHRMQALWHLIIDVVTPHIAMSRDHSRCYEDQLFRPMRPEAIAVEQLLRENLSEQWTLGNLADRVHLSPKQLSRVFVESYGKTPLAYRTMLRAEKMARLLKTSNMTVAEAGKLVGWKSRSRATQAFLDCMGIAPHEYRKLREPTAPVWSSAVPHTA